jgi:transcriptional regulator with XRE-family HTH domain
MSKSLAEVKARFSAEEQAFITARADEIMQEIDGLRPLRTAMEQTQAALADRLQISQGSVAKLEKRTDILLSTLREYVEALGGEISLVASFPGRPEIRISGLGDIPSSKDASDTAQPVSVRRRKKACA